MKETKFIEQNQEKWSEFEQMLRDKHRDPDKLNDLFIQITDDLSYARTFYPNRSVRVFLNSLAQRIFQNIYKGKRFPAERFRLFWTDELPKAMWETRRALLLAFTIFAVAFGIGVLSSIINPDFARIILGDDYVDMTIHNIENGDPMAVYKSSGPLGMTAGIAANNLFVAFRTAIFGVLASIGTVLIMLYNGIMVGAFQYFFIEKGVFWDSFLTIWIHGTLEISAIIIAGAAGLVAGSGLLFPGSYRRIQAFQISMRKGLKIFIGIVPIIIIAAVFEGFLTRYTETPHVVRGLFIATSLFFVLWYFVWFPWYKARHNGFKQAEQPKELPPDSTENIDFYTIKTSGEMLSDVFTMMRRYAKVILATTCGAMLVFGAFIYLFAEKSFVELFEFPGGPWGILSGTAAFFSNDTVVGLFMLQTFLLAIITVVSMRAVEKERFEKQPETANSVETPKSFGQAAFSIVPMLLVMPWMIILVKSGNGFLAWLVSMAAYPWLSLWAAVLYFDPLKLNPLVSISRTFKLAQWLPMISLGFLSITLGMMVFLFLDSPVWEMTIDLFRWLVPPKEGAMAVFTVGVSAVVSAFLLYYFFHFQAFCGAMQYFSFRETTDATSLHNGIKKIGKARQIRGLARE